jgi:hypothetical protein
MIKDVLPAAMAAIALAAPLTAHAQVVQPVPQPLPPPGYTTNASTTTTITGQLQPSYTETYGAVGPVIAVPVYPLPMPIMTSRTTWIPGHFDWDPARSNYVYIEGQFVEAPHENARWIPGHWAETPTAWIWINGGWN